MRQSGQLIEQLSLGVYDSVRRLLGRLRPRQLDDLPLEQAVRSLMREMGWRTAALSAISTGGLTRRD